MSLLSARRGYTPQHSDTTPAKYFQFSFLDSLEYKHKIIHYEVLPDSEVVYVLIHVTILIVCAVFDLLSLGLNFWIFFGKMIIQNLFRILPGY